MKMWCGLTSGGTVEPVFFHEKTETGALCLDSYALPQAPDEYVFQQGGAPLYFLHLSLNY
jgi:hypothetical protein